MRAFLATFLVCGLAGIELWPLTGWRLFSRPRAEVSRFWEATAVGHDGTERRIPFGRLPWAYRGALHVMIGFGGLSGPQRAGVCRAWAEAARGLGYDVAGIRIYRGERHLSVRVGERSAPPSARALRYSCDTVTVHA